MRPKLENIGTFCPESALAMVAEDPDLLVGGPRDHDSVTLYRRLLSESGQNGERKCQRRHKC